MSELTDQSWFWPAVGVGIALPVSLVVLGELHATLVRRASPAARTVLLLRNYVIPAAALLLLLTQVGEVDTDASGPRVVATALGFLVILFVLSGLNVVLFRTARPGTWRRRLPSIFIDLARLLLVVIGLAVLFSWVWGADVGGLFAALGVTSIVLGLALQNGIGSVVSGLLLLFEQPFAIGDWLEAGGVRGRVVEVNWRAAHIDTGHGIQIVPNAELAGSSFLNLSRAARPFPCTLTLSFAASDPPHEVLRVLLETAADLSLLVPGAGASAVPVGGGTYELALPIASPSHEGEARSTLLTRLWYAARRAGLHLDGEASSDLDGPDRLAAAVAALRHALRIGAAESEPLAAGATLRHYGAGETVQRTGHVPDAMLFIVDGVVSTVVEGPDGVLLPIGRLDPGEYLGLTVLTRQPVVTGAVALTETTVLAVPRPIIDALVRSRPELARELGEAIDARRRAALAVA